MSDATPIIVTSVLITLGSSVVAEVEKGQGPTFNQFLAGGFMGALLFGVELVDNELAKLLSILVIIGVLLRNGDALFGWISKKSAPAKTTTSAATTKGTTQNV
jgi:hypothetical protein